MEELRAALNDEVKFNEIAQVAFKKVDDDDSGTIDKSELTLCMESLANELNIPQPNKEEVEAAFKFLDQDKNGSLDVNEFKVFSRMVLEELLKKAD